MLVWYNRVLSLEMIRRMPTSTVRLILTYGAKVRFGTITTKRETQITIYNEDFINNNGQDRTRQNIKPKHCRHVK